MIFALVDLSLEVDVDHIEAALAWIRYWVESVQYVLSSGAAAVESAEVHQIAMEIVEYLEKVGRATRTQINRICFNAKKSKLRNDAALDLLLAETPAVIVVLTIPRPKATPGAPTKVYSLAKCAAN